VVSLFYFFPSIKPIKSTPSPSFILFTPPSHKCPHSTYFTVFLSLLIPKSMFKGVSQCTPTVNILHFDQFNHLCYSPLPHLSLPAYLAALSSCFYVFYLSRYEICWYCWLSLAFAFCPSLCSIVHFHCCQHNLPHSSFMILQKLLEKF
jgi:hypothetical protein